MGKHVDIYSKGIVHCSVCAPRDIPIGEVEELTNMQNPTGIESRWQLSGDKEFASGQSNPSACDELDGNLHWLMVC